MKKVFCYSKLGVTDEDNKVVALIVSDILESTQFDFVALGKDCPLEVQDILDQSGLPKLHLNDLMSNESEMFEVHTFGTSEVVLVLKNNPRVSLSLCRTFLNVDSCEELIDKGFSYKNYSPYSSDCVDIIMPMYNNAKTVAKSIDSVLNQTHENFNLILVDDGSFDGTEEVVKPYLKDKRVHYYKREHRGISAGLNFGVSQSKSKLLARQDADDVWLPWHLDFLLATMKTNSHLDLIGSKVFIDWSQVPNSPNSLSVSSSSGEQLWLDLAYNNVFNHSTMLFKRSLFDEVGGYNSQYDGYEDWHLWSRMVTKDNAMVVDLANVYYHVGDRNSKQMMFLSRLAKSRGLQLEDIL